MSSRLFCARGLTCRRRRPRLAGLLSPIFLGQGQHGGRAMWMQFDSHGCVLPVSAGGSEQWSFLPSSGRLHYWTPGNIVETSTISFLHPRKRPCRTLHHNLWHMCCAFRLALRLQFAVGKDWLAWIFLLRVWGFLFVGLVGFLDLRMKGVPTIDRTGTPKNAAWLNAARNFHRSASTVVFPGYHGPSDFVALAQSPPRLQVIVARSRHREPDLVPRVEPLTHIDQVVFILDDHVAHLQHHIVGFQIRRTAGVPS